MARDSAETEQAVKGLTSSQAGPGKRFMEEPGRSSGHICQIQPSELDVLRERGQGDRQPGQRNKERRCRGEEGEKHR